MGYNLGTASGRIVIDGSGAQKGFGVAETAANAFFSAIQDRVDSVKDLGTRLTQIGTTGGVGLGLAVRAAANFEQSLSAVKAVSGATEQEMDKLRETALRIGKDTSFSATEASNALEELTKAGVSVEDILNGAADATVNLAAAGQIDLPQAAEIASSAINNFALSGKELPHVADLIAGAANASAIDVGDFGYSLSQAGAVANLTGLKFDDLAVAIAEMGQAGIKGSDAGTSIKTFLTNLIPTTDTQIAKFRELGLVAVDQGTAMEKLASKGIKPVSLAYNDVMDALEDYVVESGKAGEGTAKASKLAGEMGAELGVLKNQFFDAQGNMKSFSEVQEVLQEATKGLTKEQKLATLETLFGSDAIRAAAVFADQGAEGYSKMAAAIGKVSAADVAKTRLDNLNGSIEQLKGSFETAQIIIGSVFLPMLKKLVDGITAIINVFNNLPEPVQKAIAVFLGLGTAMSLFTGIAIKLAFVLGPMVARFLGLSALKSIFSIFTTGFKVWRSGAGAAAALTAVVGRAGAVFTRFATIGKTLFTILAGFPRVLAVLRTAASLAFGPWGIAIAAIATALVLLYKNFEPFRNLINGIGSAIKDGFVASLLLVQQAWQAVVDGFNNGASSNGIVGFFQNIGVVAKFLYDALLQLADIFMTRVLPVLQQAGGQIIQMLLQSWQTLATMFQTQILPALQQLGAAFVAMLPALQQLWTALQPVLMVLGLIAAVIVGSVVVALYAFIKAVLFVLPYLIQIGTVIVQTIIGALTLLATVLTAVIAGFIAFATQIVAAVTSAVAGVATAVNGIVNVVKGMFNLVKALVSGSWADAWSAAKQIFSGFKDVIVGLFKALSSIVQGIIKGMASSAVAAFKALASTLSANARNMINSIVAVFKSLPGKAKSAISSFGSGVTSVVKTGMSRMLSAAKSGGSNVISFFRSLPGRIRGAVGNLGNILYSVGRSIIQGLLNGINSMIGSVKGALNNLTGLIPDWKGPEKKDKKLLTKNGKLIMMSLINAFRDEFPEVKKTLEELTTTIPKTFTVNGAVEKSNPSDFFTRRGPRPPVNPPMTTGPCVHNTWNVYNPVAEKTSVTTTRQATRRAALGVLG